MKKILLSCFLISVITAFSYAQQITPVNNNFRQAISIKPTNFSNIDLGNSEDVIFSGYHFGIAYERLLLPNNHWSFVLPVTFGFYNPLPVTDYDKNGYQLYFTPGVKYYLKLDNPRKGWSASANLLVGIDNYKYSGYHSKKGDVDNFFYGILASWMYNAPISKTVAFNFELGFGLKNTRHQSNYTLPDEYLNNQTYFIDEWRFSGIMNASIGISKWL